MNGTEDAQKNIDTIFHAILQSRIYLLLLMQRETRTEFVERGGWAAALCIALNVSQMRMKAGEKSVFF
jgi:hypothetical protein